MEQYQPHPPLASHVTGCAQSTLVVGAMRLTTTTPQDMHGAFLRQGVHACRVDQGLSHRHRVRMRQGSQGGDTGEVADVSDDVRVCVDLPSTPGARGTNVRAVASTSAQRSIIIEAFEFVYFTSFKISL